MVNHCATQIPNLKKAIMFYGNAPDLSVVPNIKASLQLNYAENDDRINAGRDEYLQSLEQGKIDFEFHVYKDAGHAFFNNTREDRYHKTSADLGFKRALEFLAR